MTERCAWKAVQYIKDNMIIGLGHGKAIEYLIDLIIEKKLNIKVVTLSNKIKQICLKHNLNVISISSVNHIDIAFDGCDEVDIKLNALKSGQNTYLKDKMIAKMAKKYILLVEEENVYEKLPFCHNVTLEIKPESLSNVKEQVHLLNGCVHVQKRKSRECYMMNNQGHLVVEADFNCIDDVKKLDHELNHISGVVGTSLYVGIVTSILSLDDTHVRIIS